MLKYICTALNLLFFSTSAAISQEDLKVCWTERNFECGIRSDVTIDLVKSKCPELRLYDEELYQDLVQCGGVMMCWLMSEKVYETPNLSPGTIVAYSNNLQLTPLQVEMARRDGSGGPSGTELCPYIQDALDELMPIAIEDLR